MAGYTIEKGYVGYPNPRIIVINKNTKEVTYDEVIPQKNGSVLMLDFDEKCNVMITTTIYSSRWNYSKQFPIVPRIIIDRLNNDGKFENNLFNN